MADALEEVVGPFEATKGARSKARRLEAVRKSLRSTLRKSQSRDLAPFALAVLHGEAQVLRTNPDSPRERRLRRYERVGAATARMTSLVDDYLSAERLADDETLLTIAPTDLQQLIASALSDLPPGRVSVEVDAKGVPETFPCDADLLEVALRNLLVNADRYSPPDCPFTLAVIAAPDGGIEVEVALWMLGSCASRRTSPSATGRLSNP